jgi:hypothetical protein
MPDASRRAVVLRRGDRLLPQWLGDSNATVSASATSFQRTRTYGRTRTGIDPLQQPRRSVAGETGHEVTATLTAQRRWLRVYRDV